MSPPSCSMLLNRELLTLFKWMSNLTFFNFSPLLISPCHLFHALADTSFMNFTHKANQFAVTLEMMCMNFIRLQGCGHMPWSYHMWILVQIIGHFFEHLWFWLHISGLQLSVHILGLSYFASLISVCWYAIAWLFTHIGRYVMFHTPGSVQAGAVGFLL